LIGNRTEALCDKADLKLSTASVKESALSVARKQRGPA